MRQRQKIGAVAVVGGGIAGIQSALDIANSGFKVYLIEEKPNVGGVMSQLDKTFPTNDCSSCMMGPKLVELASHRNIRILTKTSVEKLEGEPGNFTLTVTRHPRFVREDKCTGCGACLEVCPIRYEVQLPEAETAARTAYSKATDEETVEGIIGYHRDEPGNLLPILLDISRFFNWLPRSAIEHVAAELRTPVSEILRVATFYNAFSLVPRGRHIISVCLGTGCFVKGSARLLEELERKLGITHGQTTEDFLFTLQVVRCIGCCALSPAMRIGEATFGRLSPADVGKIIDTYRQAVTS